MYRDLSSVWQEAFTQAWNAFCEGTIPIGAIITDKDGNILSRGQNAIYSSTVLNPRLQHAEMNCLVNLDTRKYPDVREYFLYTTMEPCPMCMGSLTMSDIRHVRYGAHDDYAGSAHMAFEDRYISKKRIDIECPNNGIEPVQLALQSCFEFKRYNEIATNTVLDCFRARCPESFTAAVNLFTDGRIKRLVEKKVSAGEAYDTIEAECDSVREKNKLVAGPTE